MDLYTAIEKRRIIDVNLSLPKKLIYTGVCIKANKSIWIIVNYNFTKKKFDGFSVFNNLDIDSYTVWKKNGLNVKENNLVNYTALFPVLRVNTLYSCFKNLSRFGLFAIFTRNDVSSYFVGKIIFVDREKVQIRLINKQKKWSVKKTIAFSEILIASFYTEYEKGLLGSTKAIVRSKA